MKKNSICQCAVCKNGSLIDGTATMTFEKDNSVIVVKNVPALVCNNCGEEFVHDSAAREVVSNVTKEFHKGVQIEVVDYAA